MLIGDAHAGVLDGHGDLQALELGTQPNMALFIRVFGGVIEQVGEYLSQPPSIGVEVNRRRRQRDRELVALGFDEGTG